ncbi:Annexin A13 [Dinochytrium kinnereticum]|nr:Annexin A13 [Dinochytrium kinnereticum]
MLTPTASNVVLMLSSTGLLPPPSLKSHRPKRPGWMRSPLFPAPSSLPLPTPSRKVSPIHSVELAFSPSFYHDFSRSPSPINLTSLDLDVESAREQMEFLSGGITDALTGETPPLDMGFYGSNADNLLNDDDDLPSLTSAEKSDEERGRSDSKMMNRYSEEEFVGIGEAPAGTGSVVDGFRARMAALVAEEQQSLRVKKIRPPAASKASPPLPAVSHPSIGVFHKMPSQVMVNIVNHLLAMVDPSLPSSKALLLALPCLYVNRSWSRGAAKAIYTCPILPTLEKFQSIVATALEAMPTHPYAAFVEQLHLPQSLADALYLGDLDIAFQLFPNLACFRVHASPSTSNVLLQSLSDHCQGLKRLSLRGCPITDSLVPSLAKGCQQLEYLDLSHTRVTIATLVTAVDLCPSLTSLHLEAAFPSSVPVTWNPQHLFIRPLQTLNLRNSGATDPHLRHAALHCPDLSLVVLEGSAALTDDSIIKLSQSCSSLRVLDASFCPHITDLSVRSLAMFASLSLKSVSLSGCDRITPEGVEALAEGCKELNEIVLHGCASILNSHVRGFATRRYELDCAIRGDAVRLLGASRAGRKVAGPLAAAAKVTAGEVGKREFSTQTEGLSESDGKQISSGTTTPRRTLSRQPSEDTITDASDVTKASVGSSTPSAASRYSMPAEELLMKFAEAVASGTWMPRGTAMGGGNAFPPQQQQQQPPVNGYPPWGPQMFWNPAWGYPPPMYPHPGSMPMPGMDPNEGPRRVSTSSSVSQGSSAMHSNRSSFVSETSSSTASSFSGLIPPSKLKRLSSVQERTPPVTPKPSGQRSQLPTSKLPAMTSRIPSMGSRLPSLSSSLPTSAQSSSAAKEFSMAMLKGKEQVMSRTPSSSSIAQRNTSATEPAYKPRQFRKINSDSYESPAPPPSMLKAPTMSRISSSSSSSAAIDPVDLAAFASGLPTGIGSQLSGGKGRMRSSIAHPLAPSGASSGWISGGSGGDRTSTGSTGSTGSSSSAGETRLRIPTPKKSLAMGRRQAVQRPQIRATSSMTPLPVFRLLITAAAASTALAQSACQTNVLVDDMRPREASMYRTQPPGEGCEQFPGTFNGWVVVGAQYRGAAESIEEGRLKIIVDGSGGFNYWFTKFNWEQDFDLTRFYGLEMDLIAPPNSDFSITLTQWQPFTTPPSRGIDSVYKQMTDYMKPTGTKQTLRFSWSDYAMNLNGRPFDLKHLKDLTLVDLKPAGAVFYISRITLLGNCSVTLSTAITRGAVPSTLASLSGGATIAPSSTYLTSSLTEANSQKSMSSAELSNTRLMFGALATMALEELDFMEVEPEEIEEADDDQYSHEALDQDSMEEEDPGEEEEPEVEDVETEIEDVEEPIEYKDSLITVHIDDPEEYYEEEEGDEDTYFVIQDDNAYEIPITPAPTYTPLHKRSLAENLERRAASVSPVSIIFNTLPAQPDTQLQPTITGPLIGAGIAVAAVAIAMSVLVFNHRKKEAPPSKLKRPMSRLSSASKLEAQVKLSNGPAAHSSLGSVGKKRSESMVGISPVFMDRVVSSPKASPRASVSYGADAGKGIAGKGSVDRRLSGKRLSNSVPTKKVPVEKEVDEQDEDEENSDEEEEQKPSPKEEKESKVLRRSPTLSEDVKAEARNVLSALKLLKDDRPDAIKLIYKKSPQELEELGKCATAICGSSLEEELNAHCSGDVRKILTGLTCQPLEYDAICLEEAMKGVGCDEDALIELLVGRTNAEIEGIKSAYQARYNKDLEKTIASEAHGHLKRLFKIILQAQRDESNAFHDVEEDVQALYKAGVGRPGTDEMAFISILTDRSEAHLRKMFTAYKIKYKDSMEDVVKKEFKGDLEKALLGIVRSIDNRHRHVATLFEKAMKGIGHHHSKLIRLVVRHRYPDVMRQVKMEYLVEYDKSLYERIKEETSGLYQKFPANTTASSSSSVTASTLTLSSSSRYSTSSSSSTEYPKQTPRLIPPPPPLTRSAISTVEIRLLSKSGAGGYRVVPQGHEGKVYKNVMSFSEDGGAVVVLFSVSRAIVMGDGGPESGFVFALGDFGEGSALKYHKHRGTGTFTLQPLRPPNLAPQPQPFPTILLRPAISPEELTPTSTSATDLPIEVPTPAAAPLIRLTTFPDLKPSKPSPVSESSTTSEMVETSMKPPVLIPFPFILPLPMELVIPDATIPAAQKVETTGAPLKIW